MTYNLTKDYSKRINESSNNDKLDNQLEKFEKWADELKNKVFDQNEIAPEYHLGSHIKRFYKKRITTEVERFITENETKQNNQIIIYNKSDKAFLEKTIRTGPLLRKEMIYLLELNKDCLLYTSPSPRDTLLSRMPSSA